MLVFVEGGKPEYPAKNHRSKDENQHNILNPHMTLGLRFEPGPHHHCAILATAVLIYVTYALAKRSCVQVGTYTSTFTCYRAFSHEVDKAAILVFPNDAISLLWEMSYFLVQTFPIAVVFRPKYALFSYPISVQTWSLEMFPVSSQNGKNETKMFKIYTRFQTKTICFGAVHTHTAYAGEYPPPPPPQTQKVTHLTATPLSNTTPTEQMTTRSRSVVAESFQAQCTLCSTSSSSSTRWSLLVW